MNKLIYSLFLSVFFLDFLHSDLGVLPRIATWFPEILSVFAFAITAIGFGVKKGLVINFKYIYLFLLFFTIIFLGILLNFTPSGEIFVGIRSHFKHIPFFLLPAVYDFSTKQFKNQLLFIFPLLILQCPIALIQRIYFIQKKIFTGDVITGTLSGSGTLSIVMICSMAVVFAFYLRKRVGFGFFLFTAGCLFLPAAINETKITIFILPAAFLLPTFLNQGHMSSARVKKLLVMSIFTILSISGFVMVYDYMTTFNPSFRGKHPDILEFFRDRDTLKSYFYKGADGEPSDDLRRLDTFVLTYRHLAEDFKSFSFGLGMGSATPSYFGSLQDMSNKASQYGVENLALTYLFWEFGLLGVIVYTCFFVFLLKDALVLKECDDIFGAFALGWCPVIIIIGICLFYTNIVILNVLNLLFWYFSGVIAAKTCKMKKNMVQTA
ncbi:MAG: hypothetical protein ABIN18_11010 [Pseudomonadota bacterium]